MAAPSPKHNGSASVSGKQFSSVSQKNMTKIVSSTNNNIELQMMVLDTIDEYEAAAKVAQEEGKSTGEMLRSAAKRKRALNEGAASSHRPHVNPMIGEQLPLSSKSWKNWSLGNLRELIVYCDTAQHVDWDSLASISSKPQLLMLIEHGTDIITAGDQGLDRVTELNKRTLFESILRTYQEKGCRWVIFAGKTFVAFIDWHR